MGTINLWGYKLVDVLLLKTTSSTLCLRSCHCLRFVHTLSRTQVLLTKISQTCQSIRDIKEGRKQLAFHRTSNTSNRTTSSSSPPDHNNPHSSTGDGGARDDSAKKSNSSTSLSVGGTHTPGTPAHRGPRPPAPDPVPTSRSPSPGKDLRSPPPDDEGDSSPAS